MTDIGFKIKRRDFETLLETLTPGISEQDVEFLRKVYKYASNAHTDQVRLSGEPYITHPLEVAIILAGMRMDPATIAASLLHDVVEDTNVSNDEIKEKFGEEVALLVDGVTKISSLKKKSRYVNEIQNLRKMLLATINDVRVIIIKLADKVHNMRTIMFQPRIKQHQVAKEVLDIYAPLAARLGISEIRSELEDLAFHVLNPDEFHDIESKISQRKNEIEDFIEDIRFILYQQFQRLDIKAEITGRVKHYYSIYRKMIHQNRPFEDIFDIRAIRIITHEVKDCYGILGIIHTLWSPISARFKDYIAVPKSNMYQSLHTTVIGPDAHPVEFQIRTHEMHTIAEKGIAAHWIYKEDKNIHQSEYYKDLPLLQDIHKLHTESHETHNSREFMKELKMNLYEDEIFTFTPKGKIVKLAKGSTPVDFAYIIHTEVGSHCVGAKVNNNMVPLKTILKSGDIVEILTSKKGHPSESWLKFVKSSTARYKIRNWLRRNKEGMEIPDQEEERKKREKTAEVSIPENEILKIKNSPDRKNIGLSVDGTKNIQIKLSQCCQPIPGDDVIGFITRGRGITVHKKSCPSLKRLRNEPERLINIVWESSEESYPVKLIVNAMDRPNLLKDLVEQIALCKTNVLKMDAEVREKDNAIFKVILEVKSIEHLNDIITKIKKLKSITNVFKANEKVLLR